MTRAKLLATLSLALAVLAGPRAQAADPPKQQTTAERAAGHFQRGVELYDESDFPTALIEFRRAHEVSPDFRVLYNIAQCEYQLADYVNALDHFRAYLAQGGDRISLQRRSDVERDIRKLEQRVATLTVTVNVDGAEILVDTQSVGTSPRSEPVRVSAGQRTLRARKPGYREAIRPVAVAGGDVVTVSLELVADGTTPRTTTAEPSPSTPEGTKPAASDETNWTLVGGVTAGALAASAAVTGILALSASSKLEDIREVPNTPASELASQRSKVTGFAVATDVLAGAAIAIGAVTVYFTLQKSSGRRAGLSPVVAGAPGLTFSGEL